MRIEVDVGVDVGSPEACCEEGRGERVVCARGKVWHGSGGGHVLAHSGKIDHAIGSFTARAAGTGLRLRLQGEWKGMLSMREGGEVKARAEGNR